jgi:hypothetical protein
MITNNSLVELPNSPTGDMCGSTGIADARLEPNDRGGPYPGERLDLFFDAVSGHSSQKPTGCPE